MGQLANQLAERPQGSLPSNTEVNSKEQCKAVSLRSGRELEEVPRKVTHTQDARAEQKNSEDEVVKGPIPPTESALPKVPFPQRLKSNKQEKQDKQFLKFLEVFKKLHINIPFADALAQMPSYVKFMKDILSNKRKLEEYETLALTEECSAILQKKLPPKLKDPGSFTIPCTIGKMPNLIVA